MSAHLISSTRRVTASLLRSAAAAFSVALWATGQPGLVAAATSPQGNAPATGLVDFNREVRPLFAQHCTACHGGVKMAGKLSFLYRDKALANGKSGAPSIVPGKPEQSEVIRRVTSSDPDELMPKPQHGPRLTAPEIDTLRRWIQQGATWSEHWSFVPPREPALPRLKNTAWAKTTADRKSTRLNSSHGGISRMPSSA